MTATTTRYRAPVQRGKYAAPQKVGEMSVAMAGLLGISPKHAEYLVRWSRRITSRWCTAARSIGREDEIATYFSHADAQRQIDGAPLLYSPDLAVAVAKAEHRANEAILRYQGDRSAENASTLIHALRLAHGEECELLCAVESAS